MGTFWASGIATPKTAWLKSIFWTVHVFSKEDVSVRRAPGAKMVMRRIADPNAAIAESSQAALQERRAAGENGLERHEIMASICSMA